MVKLKGTGMLAVWSEVPPEHEEEFNDWYNQEHIAERLSVPGVLSAARYEAVKSGPKHLAVYELENSSVMQSSEYVNLKNNPTKWSKRSKKVSTKQLAQIAQKQTLMVLCNK